MSSQMPSPLLRNRTNVSSRFVHLVFVTKYRRAVIDDRVNADLEQSMIQTSTRLGARIEEIDGEEDHLHLLVGYPPALSISELVHALKGASARAIRLKNYFDVRNKLWGQHFWSPSFFACSCGGVSIDIVKQYIQNQRSLPGYE